MANDRDYGGRRQVTRDWAQRSAFVAATAAVILTIWVNGAVGMIGSEDNPYNLYFFGVMAVAVLGSVAARFRPAGMAYATAAAAIAQVCVAAGGLPSDILGGVFSIGFAGLWLLSAAMFWTAARNQDAARQR